MEKPRVEIDLLRDLVEIFRADLVRIGFDQEEVNGITGHEELFALYYNAARRLVSHQPRAVRKVRQFVAPRDPQQAKALDTIERKLREGETVAPYLSRKARSLSYNDHLLNDWGIHHLHLGTNLEADGFVNRTRALLYVVFGDTLDVYGEGNTDAHLIGVMSHNDFATQELLEITHANWPRLMQFGSVVGLKGDRLSDDQISVLRSRRLNYCLLLRDGKAYLPPGGGVTLSGASTLDQMRGLHRVWWAEQQQEIVLSQMPGIIEREMTPLGLGRFRGVTDLRLRRLPDGQWVLVDDTSGYFHPLMAIG